MSLLEIRGVVHEGVSEIGSLLGSEDQSGSDTEGVWAASQQVDAWSEQILLQQLRVTCGCVESYECTITSDIIAESHFLMDSSELDL